jgi:oxaloacetate decarboxylase
MASDRFSERRRRFRAYLAGERCLRPASVYDPITARIAEDLGFEMMMLGGSVAALTVLGAPDLILLTLTEFAEQISRICRAGNLPLLVDADHGYGNALNVMRTVEELERAGVAALTIEDTVLPTPFDAAGDAQLVSLEEGVGKMRAALAARRDPDLVIVGRTNARAAGGLADGIARAQAYAAAGVDAVFLIGIASAAQLDDVAAAIKVPIILGAPPAGLDDAAELARRGVRVALQGHLTFAAAVRAAAATLKALRDGVKPAAIAGIASAEEMKTLTRDTDYRRWTTDFLRRGD